MGTFTKLADNWDKLTDAQKIALFEQTSYEKPNPSDLVNIETVKFAACGPTNEAFNYALTVIPVDQVVKPDGLISTKSYEQIDNINIKSVLSGNAQIRIAVTNDGESYQTYSFVDNTWSELDITDTATFLADGIPVDYVSTITAVKWAEINTTQKIGFAYLLHIEDATEDCDTDALVLTVDMKGSWNHAVHGTDYEYGYPNNELLQVNLLNNGDFKINYNAGEAAGE